MVFRQRLLNVVAKRKIVSYGKHSVRHDRGSLCGYHLENEPVSSSTLVKLAGEELQWKRTTVHTVLRRLCDKGLFQNDHGMVTSLISREQFYALQSQQFVDNTFHGSLPAFLAAFTKSRTLTDAERDQVRKMIDEAGEGE